MAFFLGENFEFGSQFDSVAKWKNSGFEDLGLVPGIHNVTWDSDIEEVVPSQTDFSGAVGSMFGVQGALNQPMVDESNVLGSKFTGKFVMPVSTISKAGVVAGNFGNGRVVPSPYGPQWQRQRCRFGHCLFAEVGHT